MQLEAKQRANSVPIHNSPVHNFHHPRFKYPIHAMTRRFLSKTR